MKKKGKRKRKRLQNRRHNLKAMRPGITPGTLPPFHELDEYKFQDLCRDLLDREPNIATCEVYGRRGERQYGIDVLAYRQDGDGIEVGQCKCWESFPPAEIRKASDEFFKHWDRWSKENVKRFILFVACDLSATNQHETINEQKKCFRNKDIRYEAWSAVKIRNKLRPHPGIVATYLIPSDYWVQDICGAVPSTSPWKPIFETCPSRVVNAVLANQVEQLAARVYNETEKDLEAMREAVRQGLKEKAVKWVKDLKDNTTVWSILPSETKAKILCFEAGLVLEEDDGIARAKQLADEARALAPSYNQARIRALTAYWEFGPEKALELLSDQKDLDNVNLKAALLLNMGQVKEALKILDFENTGLNYK